MVKKNKIIVTGGAGFIGSNLANSLAEEGNEVFAVDNLSKGKKKNLNRNVNFIKLDAYSSKFLGTIAKLKPDYFYHLAAQSSLQGSLQNPKVNFLTNFLSIVDILHQLKKIKPKKFIFSSSSAIYGDAKNLPIKEESSKKPISPYGIAKLAAENYVNYFCDLHRMPFVILRYSNVYGPRQDSTNEGGVVAIFINQLLKKQKVIINVNGNQTRDFIYVDDVVEANRIAIERKLSGTYNVSTGNQTSINRLYKLISKNLSNKFTPIYRKNTFQEVRKSSLDSSLIKKQTHWRPKVNLKDGLTKTIEYFKENS